MVKIGIVGIGFMGRIHFLASQRLAGGRVAAVCSRDPKKLAGDWRNTRGNFGPEPGQVDLTGIKTPHWTTATAIPQAAATERRLSRAAFTGSTTERKARSRTTAVTASTAATRSGNHR